MEPENGTPAGVERVQAATRPLELGVLAVWLGMITGLTELAGLVAGRRLSGRITVETLSSNWHYVWMIPVAHLGLFGAVGLALALAAWLLPRRLGYRAAAPVLVFLGSLVLLLAVPRVHGLALLVVAAGLARQAGPRLGRTRWLRPLVRRTIAPLAVGFGTVVGVGFWWLSTAEARALASLPAAPAGAPNVLLIVLDTVRSDAVVPVGSRRDPMPNLTRLCAEGTWFGEARSPAPWTLPSHASLFTGRWPHELSANVRRPLDDTHPTLAEHLAARGFATAAFVANTHNANAWYGLDRGFAHYEDRYENQAVTALEVLRATHFGHLFVMSEPGQWSIHSVMTPLKRLRRKDAAMINRDALAWIDRHPGRPFHVFLNYYDAHQPYEPPPGAPRPYTSDPARAPDAPVRDAYDDCLAYLDSQLGRLFDELRQRNLLDQTLVIVTSDHGEGFGEHGLSGHGLSLYRQETHVPLLVRYPGNVPAGQVVTGPVSTRDIAATIVELTGTEQGSPIPGRSLSRCWDGAPSPNDHGPILAEVDHWTGLEAIPHAPTHRGAIKAVFVDGHVYIRNSDGGEELYDLEDDYHEVVDKAAGTPKSPSLNHFRSAMRQFFAPPDRLARAADEEKPIR